MANSRLGGGRTLSAILLAGSALGTAAWAAPPVLPTGGVVAAGQASIGPASAGSLTVTQQGGRAVIDWTGFSIGQGGAVRFDNGAGATLNRVTGAAVSSLDGRLEATGSVYLINPNGVIVGKSGVVDVGGSFVASTLDISNAAFLAAGPLSFAGASRAAVVNLGKVGALGGDVALIASTVSNAGSIAAPQGSAGLLSGARVTLSDASLDGGRFSVELPAAGGSVTNSGVIEAAAAELRANGGDVYALAGDTAGVVRATGVAAGGGRIWLVAEGGAAHVAGVLDAQGADGAAGSIETSGATVDLGAATVDAHGGGWLLDPINLEITAAAATTISNALATTDVTQTTSATAASGTGAQAAGAGDIILDAGAALSWGSTHALTLSAYHDVNLLGTIALTGAGSLTLRADNAATGSGTVKVTGTAGQVTLASGATANIYYNPTSYTDTATRSTQQPVAIPQVEIYTNPYANPYNAANPGTSQATTAPVTGGTVRAYMLVNSLGQLGGGLTGVGSQLNGLYALNTDIDATSTKTANPVTGMSGTYYGFIPIGYTGTGNTTNSFTGVFDGQTHTINNLYINHFTLDSNGNKQNIDAAGVFGVVTGNDTGSAFVRNLNVLSATINGSNAQNGIVAGVFQANAVGSNLVTSGTVNGYRSGGVAGQLYSGGSIQNSHSSATINANNFTDESGGLVGENYGGSLSNDYATGAVTGGAYVGGLVGSNNGNITNSYATGSVTASGSHVGGLAGSLFGNASNAYATGAVTVTGTGAERIGGLAGDGGGTWTNVYATGAVTDTAGGGNQIGGLVGRSDVVTLTNGYATGAVTIANPNNNVGSFGGLIGRAQPGYSVTNSFATGAVNSGGGANVGGLIGTSFAGTVSTSYASGAVNGVSGVGGLIGGSTDYGANAAGIKITDSYALGAVTGTGTAANAATAYLGGLIGSESHDEPTAGATITVTRSYATGLVSGNGVKGGLVGGNLGVISNSIWDRTSTGQANGVGATLTSTISNPPTISVTNLTSVQDTDATAADYAFSATSYTNAGFLFGVIPGQQLNTSGGLMNANWVQIDSNGTLNGQGGSAVATRPLLLMEYATSVINAHQLQLMDLSTGANYTLAANVDARGTATLSDVWGPTGFVAVGQNGYATTAYTGRFNGSGLTITGLTAVQSAGQDPIGLFGTVGTAGVVQNLTLGGGSFTGTLGAGSVAYSNLGTLNTVASSATISAPSGGGLVNSNNGVITASTASGAVSGSTTNSSGSVQLGGLAGSNAGTISNSTASGSVTDGDTVIVNLSGTGGLVGVNQGVITGSSASGLVTSLVDPASGGLVGLMVGNGTFGVASVINSSASGVVRGARDTGGLIGEAYSTSATNTVISGDSATGAVSGTFEVGGLLGSTTADVSTSHASGTVTSSGGTSGGLIGSLGVANNSAQLRAGTLLTDSYATGAVSVVNPTGYAGQNGGLVGFAGPASRIIGSTAGSTYASGSVTVPGAANAPAAGGLVGAAAGATITNAAATGAVSGTSFVGGLVGTAGYGFVTTSGQTTYYYTAVTGGSAKGVVSGTGSQVGGLVGENDSGSIVDSYATGAVSGAGRVGGLVGFNALAVYLNQAPATRPTPTISGSTSSGSPTTFALGAVTGTGVGAGGIAGENQGVINTVVYTPTGSAGVTGAADVGGLVGLNDAGASVTNASATNFITGTSYTGGLVGDNFGSVSNASYGGYGVGGASAVQTVTGVAGVGGLVGVNEGGATITSGRVGGGASSGVAVPVTVRGTGNDVGGIAGANFGTLTTVGALATTVTGVDHVGGLVGYNAAGSVTGAADGAVNGRDYTGGQIGLNYGALTLSGAGLGYASFFAAPSGVVAVSGRTYVGGVIGWNDAPGTATGAASPATVTATGDYVGGFAGVNKGVLTRISAAGGSVAGRRLVGGLIGLNQGSVVSSSSTDTVTGDQDVGGLVGWNDTAGTVSRSYATGAVTGRVGGEDPTTRDDYVGGLAGVNFGSLADVYATGAVSGVQVVGGLVGTNMPGGASISRAYSSGTVTATRGAAGAFAGVQGGALANTYWIQPSGSTTPGVGYAAATPAPTAVPAASANDPARYPGFDFTTVWQSNPTSPPTLRPQS